MRTLRKLLAVVAIGSSVVLSACIPNLGDIINGGGGNSPPASVAGKWSTIETSNQDANNAADIEMNISQSTGTISAGPNLIISSSPCEGGTDSMDGTVSGSSVAFSISYGAGAPTVTFTGTVSTDGLTMSGKYKTTSGTCTPADSGTWLATKFGDSSGSYMGTFSSTVITKSFNVSAAVTEDANNNIQFTANLTGANCSSFTLSGKAIGSLWQAENSGGTISLLAQASQPTYATLNAQYDFLENSCGVPDAGSGSLAKSTASAVLRPSEINPLTKSLFAKMREISASTK